MSSQTVTQFQLTSTRGRLILALLLAAAPWSAWATLPAYAQGPIVTARSDFQYGQC